MRAVEDQTRAEPDWDRLVTGVLLVGLGVVWLLSSAEVVDPNWRILLPAALVAVGATMGLLAAWGRGSDLMGTGTLLTVLVIVVAVIPASPSWRIGDQAVRPATADEVQARYSHGVGTLTIDLRELVLESDLHVEASNGIGELVVQVPEVAALDVDVRVGVGSAVVGDRESDGFSARLETRLAGEGPTIHLDLSAGIGEIRVER
ncbi:MAG: hypothetical protein JJU45_13610 [Acidimicrobiia bacterium]|nr:hypothetical protein [Acidimicrobiia bacterium]